MHAAARWSELAPLVFLLPGYVNFYFRRWRCDFTTTPFRLRLMTRLTYWNILKSHLKYHIILAQIVWWFVINKYSQVHYSVQFSSVYSDRAKQKKKEKKETQNTITERVWAEAIELIWQPPLFSYKNQHVNIAKLKRFYTVLEVAWKKHWIFSRQLFHRFTPFTGRR